MFANSSTSGLKGLFFTSIFYSSATLISGASLCLIAAPQAAAQDYTSGGIEGVLRQSDGGAASGITVTIENKDRGLRRSSVTDEAGRYRFARLPIGTYELGAIAGLDTLSKQVDVQVNDLSVANFTFGAQMADIIATGRKTVKSDFNIAELGLINDVDLLFESQPIGRDATSLALLAAGAVAGDSAFGNLPSISGSSVGENVYYINGMNITDFRNHVGSSTVPFEFYDQVEIKTGGYGAEFGRSTGGVINAVSKSGSNEFHFGANAFWEPDGLRGTTDDTVSTTLTNLNDRDRVERKEANFWLSGPVIKDHLFFYGLYNPRDDESTNFEADIGALSGRKIVTTNTDPSYSAKLDLVITPEHRLEYTFIRDANDTRQQTTDFTYDNVDETISDLRPIPGFVSNNSGGDVNILKYTGSFGDNLTLSVLGGRQTFDQTSVSTADIYPAIFDRRTGAVDARPGSELFIEIEQGDDRRELLRVDADYYLSDLFGDHHFRIGVDEETLNSRKNRQFSGGILYQYRDDCSGSVAVSNCVLVAELFDEGEFETVQTAFYIQDAWRVNEALTLNLGLRNETFDNKNADGETFIKIKDQLAARLGFGYNYNDNTQFFGSYGRYFLPVATNTNIRLAGTENTTIEFFDIEAELNEDSTPVFTSEGFGFSRSGSEVVGSAALVVNEDIDPMHQDEFILGVRHSITSPYSWMDGWDVSASLTYRDLTSTLEDVVVDAAVLEFCAREGLTGCEAIWDGTHQTVLTNPGRDIIVSTTEAEGFALTGVAEPLRLTLLAEDLGLPEAKRTYIGANFTAHKIFEWGDITTNYTLSESSGNYEGSVNSGTGQIDAGATAEFDLASLTEGIDGLLPNDRTHQFLMRGSYRFSDQFLMGANYTLTSPRKFGCLGVHPTDAVAQRFYANQSRYCDGELVERGSALESDWINNIDLSFVLTPDIVSKGKLSFRTDIFNVFDAQGVTDIQEFNAGSRGLALTTYGETSAFQSPRSVRFGVSYAY